MQIDPTKLAQLGLGAIPTGGSADASTGQDAVAAPADTSAGTADSAGSSAASVDAGVLQRLQLSMLQDLAGSVHDLGSAQDGTTQLSQVASADPAGYLGAQGASTPDRLLDLLGDG